MHILEIVSFLPPYGGYFAIEQACALREAGHEVRMLYVQQLGVTVYAEEFFTARYNRWWHTERNNRGTEIDIYQANFRGIPKTIRWNEERYCKIIGEMFDEYVKQYGRPDVLHAQAAKWAGVAAMKIAERTGIPYFVTEHFARGSYEMNFGKGWTHDLWAKSLITECYQKAQCVIPVSENVVQQNECYFGRNFKTKIISNIIDTDFFEFRHREKGKKRFRFCCLAIANKDEYYRKGYDVLAKAFALLIENKEDQYELHIAGRSTDTMEFRKQFVCDAERDISDKVLIIHGDLDRNNVRKLLYDCDALVLASRSETQGLVLLEALSTGIPIATTEAIPKSVCIEGASFVAPIEDANALMLCMQQTQNIVPTMLLHQHVVNMAASQHIAELITSVMQGR